MTTGDYRADAAVELVPYDLSWPSLFDRERAALASVLTPWLAGPIEHVGSTAVPGLIAKPVIDIMVAVESLDASRASISAVAEIGYVYFPYRTDVMHWFCKPSPAFRTHHLHLVPMGSRLWTERLAFRDTLRNNPATAADYAALKQRLAKQYTLDREGYTNAKGSFVRSVVALALGHDGTESS